ncbi:DUF6622 family protein [Nitrospirillum viridazoti]|uniref:DUF1453 domain-containing protein n=1 Tax=Nitrospirillum viridazoti CBAmc TaxID=1441467 RepID=A0A248JMV1_9PROT|nr:DUF6622 family protein [Nitrospirillum amazonense]ASG20035.1 hypothetical protein Y958_03710 [Nitrospirillum amazonense CBAmc]TWB36274.1 hypothetical protein FBZ91_109133 [Nitrospirillum amazonense]
MEILSRIISHTPTWIFALFAFLVFMGARRLRTTVQQTGRVWLIPGVFIIWGLYGLVTRPGPLGPVLLDWAVGAVIGLGLASLTTVRVEVDRERGLVRQPGSWVPLARNLFLFGSHYVLNVLAAARPDLHDTAIALDIGVSGFSVGYFAGWSWGFIQSYRRAPDVALALA